MVRDFWLYVGYLLQDLLKIRSKRSHFQVQPSLSFLGPDISTIIGWISIKCTDIYGSQTMYPVYFDDRLTFHLV